MLEEMGCDVVTARSGNEAIAAISSDPRIDLLITDIWMPGLSGSQLAHRAHSFRQELGVILMSGNGHDQLQGFPLLHKPFSKSDLQHFMQETTGACDYGARPAVGNRFLV